MLFNRIETQDVLFKQKRTERIIEIGPANTLVSMAKRTLASRYRQTDSARYIKRKLLSYENNVQEICYEEHQNEKLPAEDSIPEHPRNPDVKEEKVDKAPPQPLANAPAAPSTTTPLRIDDKPVPAKEILVTIVALKLKKSVAEIQLTKSIKQLVGGLY